ncbi:hypothetical protein DsansV1_C19g0161411 [Dioscorea sansibarensis]
MIYHWIERTSFLGQTLLSYLLPSLAVGIAYCGRHAENACMRGTSSKSLMPAHLVCCHTPQASQATILAPSSSLAPQEQSTTQSSVPRSMLNSTSLCSSRHFPLILTVPLEPIKFLM